MATPNDPSGTNPTLHDTAAADGPLTTLPSDLGTALDGDENGSCVDAVADHTYEGEQEINLTRTAPTKKKKKKRNKARTKGQKKLGTGFEEYFVDRPLTVAEHEEEKRLYDVDPFLTAGSRIETAIQRYQAKRALNPERRNVFTKYMSYGGVDVGPKMFGGSDPRDLKDMDAEEIRVATAHASIPKDRSEWIIDFEAVAKGFFSSVVPWFFDLEKEELVNMTTGTIKNFYNYILYHDVCPEYRENILAARSVCDTANEELWRAREAFSSSPGDFNTACSTLFGGHYFGFYIGTEEGAKEKSEQQDAIGMPDETARKVTKFAVAGAGSFEQASQFRDLATKNELKGVCVDENGFEIISITEPDSGLRDFYKEYAPDLQAVGKIRARAWRDPGMPEEDLAPEERNQLQLAKPNEFEFFVEESRLKLCFVGMKVRAAIWELNCGVHYFDRPLATYCSFYTVLPNDSMIGWKKPRDLRDDELTLGKKAVDGGQDEDGDVG
ncbi:hypothetical protein AJ80_01335 [Polytolypa hystricis UAMH7299]|uniref:Uncharacterized protein n=1 Tax=Polytolypa hystricis (strain UAMH7299) TaxID=1447883 RepID=A0A2B7Z0V7_POLH7|nr:hypothetical protein AJ80_01335 [Polytolypa hystricis UAMH7299]